MVLSGLAAIAVVASPSLRAQAYLQWTRWTGWTEDARRADPVGFAQHAEQKLRQDMEVMEKTRRELAAEVGQLSRKIREQQAMSEQAMVLAREFRNEYQEVSSGGRFPVEVRGAAYTEAQVRSQVSMLLAEADGYEQSLEQLRDVKQEAESRMESLAVRINTSQAQRVGLSAKIELLRARQLTVEGERLLAQVDELMDGNTQLIEGNPVRTVRELMDTPAGKPEKPASTARVRDFLAEKPRPAPAPAADVDASQVSTDRVALDTALPATAKPKAKRRDRTEPIFQQF